MKRAYKRWVVLLLWGFLAGWVAPAASRADDAVAVAVQRGKQAGVPEQALNHILTLGYEYDLQPDEVARFLDLSREARRSDLPLDPLIGKMDEGLAKRVRVRTVARAVEKEMNRYRFVRQLARKAMDRNSIQSRHLRGRDLARMAKAASMGLQDSELEAFFSEAPPASMAQYAHALELTAAMKQSGLDFAKGKEIAFAGLERGYFSESAWALAVTVHAAKKSGLSDAVIAKEASEVVQGGKSIQAAQESLNLDTRGLTGGSRDGMVYGGQGGEGGQVGAGPGGAGPGGGSGAGSPGGGAGAGGPGGGPGGGAD